MANLGGFGALVEGFQKGAEFSEGMKRSRARRALEEQAAVDNEYLLRRKGDLSGDPISRESMFEDPYAAKLASIGRAVKSVFSKKKGGTGQAIDLGGSGTSSNPVGPVQGEAAAPATTTPLPEEEAPTTTVTTPLEGAEAPVEQPIMEDEQGGYPPAADGGSIDEVLDRNKASAKDLARGTDRFAETSRAAGVGRKALEVGGRAAKAVGRVAAPIALASTAIDTATTPTEQYRERFGLQTDDPSLAGDVAVRTLGAASDLGSALTLGQADKLYRDKQRIARGEKAPWEVRGATPQQARTSAIPVNVSPGESAPEPAAQTSRAAIQPKVQDTGAQKTSFADLDIDAKDVPDMKLDEWKQYREKVMKAYKRSGAAPEEIAKAMQGITAMQQDGFLSYGQQGLALQQAGNIKGAMAAYRAAFQYFASGTDVEFGVHKGRDGRAQVVGVGRDEKTGKVIPGTEMVMDPERVAALLENFSNPNAFRAWTKDWRDFELKKQELQVVADANANRGEAAILTAENQALRAQNGAGGSAGAQARVDKDIWDRLGMLRMENPELADRISAQASDLAKRNPGVAPSRILYDVMSRNGIYGQGQPAQPAATPRQALPVQ